MTTVSASQRRAADWTSVSSTACRSNVERLITLSTSAVAVCCCSEFTQLVEQPRVLDGDDGLGGEVRDQLDLLVGKGTDFLAVNGERTDQFVLLQHWDSQKCPYTAEFDGRNVRRIASFNVALRPQPNRRRESPSLSLTCDRERCPGWDEAAERLRASAKAGGVLCVATRCKGVAVPAIDVAKLGVADAYGLLQHGRKHRLKIAGRAADNPGAPLTSPSAALAIP